MNSCDMTLCVIFHYFEYTVFFIATLHYTTVAIILNYNKLFATNH